MSRKHENFNYSYGWKSAPEMWRFYLNGKLIPLDLETTRNLALMCLRGNVKCAEDYLKRMLRKDEKNPKVIGKCICFFKENSNVFYYSEALMYNPNNIQEALSSYKKWKNYIMKNNCMLEQSYEMTKGYYNPLGENEFNKKNTKGIIDLTRRRTIKVLRKSIFY